MTRAIAKRLRVVQGMTFHNLPERSMFSGCITIDPSQVRDAWEVLSTDTWAEEVAEYPTYFHDAFLAALKQKDYESSSALVRAQKQASHEQ